MTPIPDSLTLAGVFLLGLGLNLTPCVYPMLSVTIALFGANTQISRARAFAKALVYVLGIAAMYTTLGVFAAFTGGLFGALLQNRWVLIGISILLGALALSLFGIYNFQMPGWLLQKASGRKEAGLAGIFLSGLLVGIFAAPCIGPPIIALLTLVGTKGNPFYAFKTFFVMSLGLGAPYLFLGTFSSLLSRLPKSGVWLVWVERLFGVLLLALAGFYLILALNPKLLKWLPVLGLILGGLYLGFIESSASYGAGFLRFKRSAGILAIAAGVLLPLAAPRQGVMWESFTAEKLASAQSAGRPAILDFYADWCIPCHELDRFTYSDPHVINALSGFGKFKVDMTDTENQETEVIMNRFEILGVPTIIFLGRDGHELKQARITGFIPAKTMNAVIRCAETSWSGEMSFERCAGEIKE